MAFWSCSKRPQPSAGVSMASEVAPVICVDGPGGSGKSALAGCLAQRLGWRHLDSGSLYRMVAASALERGLSLEEPQALVELATGLDIGFGDGGITLGGAAPPEDIRSEQVGSAASTIATYPEVRAAILAQQRRARRPPGLVADGRDMGTVVFPDAELKIFLEASPEVRAERRNKQLKDKGLNVSFRALLAAIHERDARDRERAAAPLKPADDAIVVDSTGMNLGEVLAQALTLVDERGLVLAGLAEPKGPKGS